MESAIAHNRDTLPCMTIPINLFSSVIEVTVHTIIFLLFLFQEVITLLLRYNYLYYKY